MLKLAGSLCVLAGGCLIWWRQLRERRRKRNTLLELTTVLRRMGEEIRMARTPLPQLLEDLAEDCRGDAATLLRSAATAARRGELSPVWRREAESLPLTDRDRAALRGLDLHGDEEKVCKELSCVAFQLANSAEEWERTVPEATRRSTALCFSGAALLIILLL